MRFHNSLQTARLAGVLLLMLCVAAIPAYASENQADEAHKVPAIDGGIGPCSVEFTVRDSSGKPLYAAKVRVHIAYGFMNVRKLDLEQGTNVDGKASFTGLPQKVKQPLEFTATKDNLQGSATYNPAESCKATRTITLEKHE